MQFETPNFWLALPEIVMLVMACVVLLVGVYADKGGRVLAYRLSQATLVVTALILITMYEASPSVTFSGTFVSDGMGTVLKVVILALTYFMFFYAKDYLLARDLFKCEYYVLGLCAVLGMMVLVSAHSFLTIYLGLELLSLSLYAMVALNRDSHAASEAAMKYFVLGALASGMLLYGISMIYGTTGSLDLGEVRESLAKGDADDLVMALGLVFVVVGIAFKFGAAPFHMWVPDVYEGAPTPVAMFVGTAPKLAAFAMAIRLLADAMPTLQADWGNMLIVLAILSMAVGNIIAIAQGNLKRMLAYSTIAHMGYLFLGLLTGTPQGYAASMFYVIVYAVMSLGAFAMIILLSRTGFEADRLDDFKGLNERNGWYAFLMLILMFSMAGVPPFLGFWAKWSVLRELVNADMVWLAVVAVIFSVIGLFYYLRIVKLMYFDEPVGEVALAPPRAMQIMVSTNALLILVLGLFPGTLLALAIRVFSI